MYRLLPFIFLLAIVPDSEKHLETLNSFIMATKESVLSIRSGFETFHATMKPFMMNQTDKRTNGQNSTSGGEGAS